MDFRFIEKSVYTTAPTKANNKKLRKNNLIYTKGAITKLGFCDGWTNDTSGICKN